MTAGAQPGQAQGQGQRPPRFVPPRRAEVIARLDRAGLLPAITFIFSRAGCDAAVQQCLAANLRLTTPAEADEIAALVADRTSDIPDDDLPVLGYDDWLAGLVRGVAAHHAGLLPTFKEVVEELFAAGLIRAVFATETLALGINMPARTVVIERLDKWNGETHAALTAGEYTQLTGRAGRRGIDVEGHAVVLWQPGIDPLAVAGLAGTRTYPLNSSFQPSYNMAVNLVGQVGRERAAKLLESSFAQFQADRAVVGLAAQARKLRESVTGLTATCDRGDFLEYAQMRSELSQLEKGQAKDRSAARRAVGSGVAQRPAPRRHHRGARRPAGRHGRRARAGHRSARPGSADPDRAPAAQAAVAGRVPRSRGRRAAHSDSRQVQPEVTAAPKRSSCHHAKQAGGGRFRSASASVVGVTARTATGPVKRPRPAARSLTCAAGCASIRATHCPDANAHARQTEKFIRAEREAEALDRRVASRAHVITRTFERVCALLGQLGYLEGDSVTSEGRTLASIYSELDLLTAECLRRGIWDGLNHAELAACVSALTFEARRPEDAGPPRLPGNRVASAVAAMTRLWGELDGIEHDHRLSFLREPDFGFAWTSHAWASGRTLEHLLHADLTPGDFVRAVKQLIDLLDQIRAAAGESELAQTAATSIRALRRGVVAYTSVQ